MAAFRTGFMVGRFQPLHKGHMFMMMKGATTCNRFVVGIGSADKSGTERNPFTYRQRRKWIKKCNPFVEVISIDDLNDTAVDGNEWGDYLLATIKEYLGALPQLYISGEELVGRTNWFRGLERAQNLSQLITPRQFDCSASLVRESLIKDDYLTWKMYMPQQLANYDVYEEQRKTIMRIMKQEENNETVCHY